MPVSPEKAAQWSTPSQVMQLHRLKQKKKALQARINKNGRAGQITQDPIKTFSAFEDVLTSSKRKNPFLKNTQGSKKPKIDESIISESSDGTLFKLLNNGGNSKLPETSFTSFNNILSKLDAKNAPQEKIEIVKATGKKWLPIDWSLKSKMRMIALKPFSWNQKLKISEEASGITGFARCIDCENSQTNLDDSPNAKFHQCCLVWQQPVLPWLTLFPRNSAKNSMSGVNLYSNSAVKNSLFQAWTDSFRSLYQLIRTRQCPYFYMCANSFTVVFRAAGLCGYTDAHVFITPTTRGFRQLLKQEEIVYSTGGAHRYHFSADYKLFVLNSRGVHGCLCSFNCQVQSYDSLMIPNKDETEFTMPLKKKRYSDQGYETWDSESGQADESQMEIDKKDMDMSDKVIDSNRSDYNHEEDEEDVLDELWLKKMGISAEDIKQINYTQARIQQKTECQLDNSDLSLVLIEGVEVNALFNFLINCKSTIATTGTLAGVPPTLLAPVAFHGATLNSLKVRENKINYNGQDFYCLELLGPILPNTVHNLFAINSTDHSITATFTSVSSTEAFSKVTKLDQRKSDIERNGTTVFGQENLSECGLSSKIIKHFCSADSEIMCNVECIKYCAEDKTFTWT